MDGVRALVAVAGDRVRITSRSGNDVTASYPELGLRSDRPSLFDGEIVASDAAGMPDFGRLQQRMHVGSPGARLLADVPVSFLVFDVLVDGDERLLDRSYDERRARLAALDTDRWPRVSVPASFTDVTGDRFLQVVRQNGLGGVAKRRDAGYEPGRRPPSWVKTALLRTQEVVLCGWTPGSGRRRSTLGSLLLGAYDEHGRLRFLGHVGTGFTEAMLHDLLERLEPLRRPDSPFDETVPREHARRARWVDPRLVGEVEFRRLTTDRRLQHAAWRGLRPDREPREARFTAEPGPGAAGDDPDERLPAIARCATWTSLPNRRAADPPPGGRRRSSCSATGPAGCTTTYASRSRVRSPAGRCREGPPSTRMSAGRPCTSRTTRWTTARSRA